MQKDRHDAWAGTRGPCPVATAWLPVSADNRALNYLSVLVLKLVPSLWAQVPTAPLSARPGPLWLPRGSTQYAGTRNLALTPSTNFLACVGEGDRGTAALAGPVTSEPFALFHRWSDRTEP